MDSRHILKNLVQFAKREYDEKRPKLVQVLRVKSKTLLTRGILPSLQIRQVGAISFIITADYSDIFRIYYFDHSGKLLYGDNIEPTAKVVKNIEKSTKLEYQFPKKEIKVHPKDLTSQFQDVFLTHLKRVNQLIGVNIKFPYDVIANPQLEITSYRSFGSRKSKTSFEIPANALKDYNLDIIVVSEIFYQYLLSIFPSLQQSLDLAFLDLSLILSDLYFNFHRTPTIHQVLNTDFIKTIQSESFNFTALANEILSLGEKRKPITKEQLSKLLKINHRILSFLYTYQIKISTIEFFYLLREIYYFIRINCFNDVSNIYSRSLRWDFSKISSFYLNIFNNAINHIKDPYSSQEGKKELFLITILALNSNPREMEGYSQFINKKQDPFNFMEIIRTFDNYIKEPYILRTVKNVNTLVSDSIVEFIKKKIIKINVINEIQGNKIELIISIENNSNYVFANFTYELAWRPRNRLKLTLKEQLKKGKDLHNLLESKYTFFVLSKGNCSIYCKISFQDVLLPSKLMSETIKLQILKL